MTVASPVSSVHLHQLSFDALPREEPVPSALAETVRQGGFGLARIHRLADDRMFLFFWDTRVLRDPDGAVLYRVAGTELRDASGAVIGRWDAAGGDLGAARFHVTDRGSERRVHDASGELRYRLTPGALLGPDGTVLLCFDHPAPLGVLVLLARDAGDRAPVWCPPEE